MAERSVDVHVIIGRREVLAGRLWSHRRRTESMSFRYDESYLAHPGAYALDPDLPLVTGSLATPLGKSIFGAFSDSAPDRWGRRLIARGEAKRVEREGGGQRRFGEFEYLLGVRDDVRQGALRFALPGTSEYQAPGASGVPPLIELPRLLGAAERLDRGTEDDEDLRILLKGGSSLGGARPKAHVMTEDARLAIAKFPSPSTDDWDVIRWESVALDLADKAGIRTPGHELLVVDDRPVLILNRFDRAGDLRVGYASALTMLGLKDGEQASYPELADIVTTNSPSARDDLQELWRRMAFNVLTSNFDDHLGNHGFLRTSSAGWSLSPAFDLNPDPRPGGRLLQTSLDRNTYQASLTVLMDIATEFGLNGTEAQTILGQVSSATSQWREIAKRTELQNELEIMAPAFEHPEAEEARALTR